MLIWDTGEYEVLPYDKDGGESGGVTDDDLDHAPITVDQTQQAKLRDAFQKRKIKLRLHGTRLPTGYTVSLRLTKDNYRSEQPGRPSRKRKRKAPSKHEPRLLDNTNKEHGSTCSRNLERDIAKLDDAAAVASDDEDESIRANNAYVGATNDVGSVHQRRWFLSVDRRASGFAAVKRKASSGFVQTSWEQTTEEKLINGMVGGASGFERFVVGGRDTERSVVTGRLAREILVDEGVVGYIPRGLWRPITE